MSIDLQLAPAPVILSITLRAAPAAFDLLTELTSARDFSSDFSIDFNGGVESPSSPAVASSTDILASSTSVLASGS